MLLRHGMHSQTTKAEIKRQIMLELLVLCDIGLSPQVVERNWSIDRKLSRELFSHLAEEGLAEHIGDEVYVPTAEAYSLVEDSPMIRCGQVHG